MKHIKLLSVLLFLLLWQGCEQHEEILNEDKPKYDQSKIDPTEDSHLMNMLSTTLSGVTNSNGRMMNSPMGNINLEEALRVEHFANDVVRYTFHIESDDNLMVSNLILKETPEGEVSGYIIKYLPNTDWMMNQAGHVDFTNFTGYIAFSYLNGQDYYVIKVQNGIGYAYTFPNLEHSDGRMLGDCDGQGTSSGGSSGGGSGFYDQYGSDYTWSSNEVAYLAGGGTGSQVENETINVVMYPKPPPLPARMLCVGDGFPESSTCTDDTSPDAAEEACTTEPIGVLDEDMFKKCDDGFVKNINRECVPCPDGDCSDCPEGQFRDICGKCVQEVISAPSHIEGRCNGIRQMLVMQSETNKEVAGFFTADGQMIILPNGGNLDNKSFIYNVYQNGSGQATHSFYAENGKFYADYYDVSGNLVTKEVIGLYHTHPDNDGLSDDDIILAQEWSAIGNFYFVDFEGIHKYYSDWNVETETTNCKRNPEPTDCA